MPNIFVFKSHRPDEWKWPALSFLQNDRGSIMLIVLLVLSLITILGLSSSKTSFIEMQISSNQTIHKDSFYTAEAAIAEGVQAMEDTDLENSPPVWLVGNPAAAGILTTGGAGTELADLFTDAIWTANSQISAALPTAQMMSASRALCPGSSQVNQVHCFDVYGRGQQNNGLSIVKTAFRKAY